MPGVSTILWKVADDDKGTTVKVLLRTLVQFGPELRRCREWYNKPAVPQCSVCQRWGHSAYRCRSRSPFCAVCAETHPTAAHNYSCKTIGCHGKLLVLNFSSDSFVINPGIRDFFHWLIDLFIDWLIYNLDRGNNFKITKYMITHPNNAKLRWLDLLLKLCTMANNIQYVLFCLALFEDLKLSSLLNDPVLDQLGSLNLFVRVHLAPLHCLGLFGIVYILI